MAKIYVGNLPFTASEADVRTLIDDGPFLPEDALAAGLVDEVAYEDQVDDKLRAGEQRRHLDGDD